MPIQIDTTLCQGCGVCVEVCPTEAIRLVNSIPVIYDDLCNECGECAQACPTEAISIHTPEKLPIAVGQQTMLKRENEEAEPTVFQKTLPWVAGALMYLGKEIAENLAGAIVQRIESLSESSALQEKRDTPISYNSGIGKRGRNQRLRRRRRGRRTS